jgi:LysW-gamma-L-lysine carboxypeptidase
MIMMRKKSAIDLLADMLRIYTPSLQEAPLAEYLAERMAGDFGFKNVRIDEVNNVTGEVGSGSPTILLSGHMDTVPGNQPVKITKDSIHGRGACDAKASLASMVAAASDLSTRPDMGKVIVAGVSDEEGNGLGTRALLDSGIDADYAIFGEPSGIDNVTIGYKGRLGFTLTCGAPSLHASAPWLSQNAIESIYEVWRAVKTYAAEQAGKNQYSSVTASLTGIHGGSSHNTTPEKCSAAIDMRIPPQLSAGKSDNTSYPAGEAETSSTPKKDWYGRYEPAGAPVGNTCGDIWSGESSSVTHSAGVRGDTGVPHQHKSIQGYSS